MTTGGSVTPVDVRMLTSMVPDPGADAVTLRFWVIGPGVGQTAGLAPVGEACAAGLKVPSVADSVSPVVVVACQETSDPVADAS